MSSLRVPNQGEEAFLDLILAVNYTLRLFSNDVAVSESLTEASFTEATFTGYAALALTGGSWTSTPGDPGVGTYAQQSFVRSSTGAAQSIYGYYVVTTAGGLLRWYEKFDNAVVMELINDEIRVTPRMTLRDQVDTA